MGFITTFILVLFVAVKVDSMAIKGPALTRYDPCGLGIVHFDKISEGFWQGVVNVGMYPNVGDELTLEFDFEERVKIYGASQNSSFRVSDNWHNFVFKPKEPVLPRFIFYVNIESNETDVPNLKKFALNNVTLCDDEIRASQTIQSLNVTEDEKHYQHVCGRRALDHAELTSVRTSAKAGDWPWHVAIMVKDKAINLTRYECGGSIISKTAIVTAGHCVSKGGNMVDPERLIIIAGISNHSDLQEEGRQQFTADQIILHPNFNDVQATADLAVIKFKKIEFTDYVQPICVWGPVYDKRNLFGYQATVVGFGTTEENRLSQVLRSTYTLVQNDTTCIDYQPHLYRPLLNEFTFCAGYGPNSTINPRNGDSGGGLVVPTVQSDNMISWFLRGVLSKCGVSAGHTECDPKFYVVYTDVGPHYGWIYHHSGLRFANNIMK